MVLSLSFTWIPINVQHFLSFSFLGVFSEKAKRKTKNKNYFFGSSLLILQGKPSHEPK
jgi:hypothetical protein